VLQPDSGGSGGVRVEDDPSSGMMSGPHGSAAQGARRRGAAAAVGGLAGPQARAATCCATGLERLLGLLAAGLGCAAAARPTRKRKRGTGGLPADGPQANLGQKGKEGLGINGNV
jgi:hypothetical protein